jgi:purine-binding chemotaxis protein CheW
VSSEDQKKRDAFAAIQQLMSQSPSVAALQMQLAQGQFGMNSANSTETPSAIAGEQYLVFSLADRELAVKAELVQGVERLVDLTPVPNVVPWVSGVVNQRGSIVSVVDLRMFLDLEQIPYTPRTRLLVLQCNEMVISLVVDGVSEMLPISATMINGNVRQTTIPSWAAPYAAGSALLSNRVMVILDVARLLFSEKMQRYKAQ